MIFKIVTLQADFQLKAALQMFSQECSGHSDCYEISRIFSAYIPFVLALQGCC